MAITEVTFDRSINEEVVVEGRRAWVEGLMQGKDLVKQYYVNTTTSDGRGNPHWVFAEAMTDAPAD